METDCASACFARRLRLRRFFFSDKPTQKRSPAADLRRGFKALAIGHIASPPTWNGPKRRKSRPGRESKQGRKGNYPLARIARLTDRLVDPAAVEPKKLRSSKSADRIAPAQSSPNDNLSIRCRFRPEGEVCPAEAGPCPTTKISSFLVSVVPLTELPQSKTGLVGGRGRFFWQFREADV